MKNYFRIGLVLLFMLLAIHCSWAKELTLGADFKLTDLKDNKTVTLSSYRGRQPVILFFWTTWCPFCQKEIKVLNNLYPELENNNIKVLAINAGESLREVNNYLKKADLKFSVFSDRNGEVASAYEVLGVPTYIFLNQEGQIIFEDNSFPANYKKIILKSEN